MPELPEVETSRQDILTHLARQQVKSIKVRQTALRWPVPKALEKSLPGSIIQDVKRRGKYLLVLTNRGTIIIHLGMSGHLRVLKELSPAEKHDHIDMILNNGKVLRFTDPRRFGCWLWTIADPLQHPLLKHLGPEPLTQAFSANHLFQLSRNRKVSIKSFIMNHHIVVGVGNIYASEALFLAQLHPERSANLLTKLEYAKLVKAIKQILTLAIKVGGTTIRNFLHGENEGKPGYFKQQLWVYGRQHQSCKICQNTLELLRINQRSSVFCPKCQR